MPSNGSQRTQETNDNSQGPNEKDKECWCTLHITIGRSKENIITQAVKGIKFLISMKVLLETTKMQKLIHKS